MTGDQVDSNADTVDIANATRDPVAAVKTLSPKQVHDSGTESTMIAPTATPDDHISEEAGHEISASFPIADRGRYDVKREHARGGLGRILHAHDKRLNRAVAIKELLRSGEGAEARFLREAVVTARLEHPSIVPVHDMGRWSSGAPFYAMKMVSGSSLEQRLKDSSTIERRLALLPNLVAVADAMAYAHSKGVIHRDLKPSNVVVGEFGESIVIDWGLAKDAELADELATLDPGLQAVAEGLTIVGAVMGTPAYMPPEQAEGKQVDERADVYALGAMLYHLLCGRAPYEGEQSKDVLAQVTSGPPTPLDAKLLDAPVELVAICDKAMARDVSARYQSADRLVEDLKRFQTGQLVSAHAYSTWSHLRRWLARYRAPVGVAAVGLLVLVVIGVISVRRIVAEKRTAEQQRTAAETQRAAAETQRAVAERRSLSLLEEQGRQELLADRSLRALVYLSRAFSDGADGPRIRSLLKDAMRRVDGLHVVFDRHTRSINGLAWSPDGRRLVTSSDDKTVRVWDVIAKRQVGELIGHRGAVAGLAFSGDGKRIITAGKDGVARVWDAFTFRSLTTLDGHARGVQSAAFSPTGGLYLTCGNDWTAKLWKSDGSLLHTLRTKSPIVQFAQFDAEGKRVLTVGMRSAQLWDVATGELVHSFAGHKQVLFHAALSPDGTRVATTSFDATTNLWDPATGKLLTTLKAPGAVQYALFSPDSEVLLTVGRNRHAVAWDAGDGRKLRALPHALDVWSAGFAPDGLRFATASGDGSARLWDGRTGGLIARLPGHRRPARLVAFNRDGSLLASAGDDGQVRVWKTDAWKLKATIAARSNEVNFDPDGSRLVTTGRDGRALIWDARSFAKLSVLDGRPPKPIGSTRWTGTMTARQAKQAMRNMAIARSLHVRNAMFSPDGKRVVTITGDPNARVWDPQTGERIFLLHKHRGTIMSAAFSPDSKLLVTSSGDSSVVVWQLDNGRMLRHIQIPGAKSVKSVAFSPDGRLIAAGGDDRRVRVWQVGSWKLMRTLERHTKQVNTVQFTRDGKRLLSASDDATVNVWNVATGTLVTTVTHKKKVRSAQFSHDGTLLTTASEDRTAKIWNAATGKLVASFDGHSSFVMRAVFSPDDTMVVTVSHDGTAKVWDARGGRLLATMDGHKAAVKSAAFHPDGSSLVTVSADGYAMVWDLSRERRSPADIARRVAAGSPWRLDAGRLMPKD